MGRHIVFNGNFDKRGAFVQPRTKGFDKRLGVLIEQHTVKLALHILDELQLHIRKNVLGDIVVPIEGGTVDPCRKAKLGNADPLQRLLFQELEQRLLQKLFRDHDTLVRLHAVFILPKIIQYDNFIVNVAFAPICIKLIVVNATIV